ncbi:MAG: CDP-diacylglycerol--serine O-phosphatidyltransferase [Cytophagaceae bacterium]|nr:CDP-diacylglycerol--serine O-phosphatidyltransferase [Cytophagaceae bacterium]MBK9936585.1 CDP-diacylglycerol--serine O-phosphatidyltransferase [Cytophagaceae bacterium]MBL0300338.1 CDP-diacylglycerol--serine O-phosphatidyltransferase [Cytophagaceae bacterium]MBL0327270.1 CDP-diacylglycerol--serine O-phosphatidyltransferase [Cytophagaceae bacterium]
MKIYTIPNLITLGNLACGILGIIFVFDGDLQMGSKLMLLALILDFLDGFVARMFNMGSDIGKQLDSLADMVTFGVLPSFILYFLMKNISGINPYLTYFPIILAAASALRLAKFNIDERQSDSFIGLPTPANGMVVATFPFLISEPGIAQQLLQNQWIIIGYVLLFSFLLNAEIPLFALKFKDFSWKKNNIKYLFLAGSIIILGFIQLAAIPLIILAYILISFIFKSKI